MISFIVDSLSLLTVALGAEALVFVVLDSIGLGTNISFFIAVGIGFFAALFVARQLGRI